MHGKIGRLLATAVLGALLLGCMDAKVPTPRPGEKIELTLATSDEVLSQVRAQKDKVVIVDVWASWCRPCQQEFPNLLVLDHDYAGQGVSCLSVSIDEASTHKNALAFLRKVGSTIPNYRVLDGEEFQRQFGIQFIPTILVFEDGKFLTKFNTYDELRPYLRKLMAKKTKEPAPSS